MEKNNVTFFHLKINLIRLTEFFILFDPKIRFIDHSIPIWVFMIIEFPFMSFGNDVQCSVFFCCILQWRPCSNNSICWAKWEISQILMHWMPWTASHSWWFIDEHRMDWFYIFTTKTFQVRNKLRVFAITLENIIKLKILQLCDRSLTFQFFSFVLFHQSNIFHDLHSWKTKIDWKTYLGIFLSQYSKNLSFHFAISSSFRNPRITIYPFSS